MAKEVLTDLEGVPNVNLPVTLYRDKGRRMANSIRTSEP